MWLYGYWLLYLYFVSSLIISYHFSENTQRRKSKPKQQSKQPRWLGKPLKIGGFLLQAIGWKQQNRQALGSKTLAAYSTPRIGPRRNVFFVGSTDSKDAIFNQYNKYIHKKCLYRSSPCASLVDLRSLHGLEVNAWTFIGISYAPKVFTTGLLRPLKGTESVLNIVCAYVY